MRRIFKIVPAFTALVALLAASPRASSAGPKRAPLADTGCSTDSTLCLGEGRFLVDATWTKPDGESGIAHAVALTPDSGYFWILEPGNVELAVKTLNGCSTNHRYWFFSGGLTNLQVEIHVTDTTTNQTRTYSNPQGRAFQPIVDTSAFSSCPAGAESVGNPEEPSERYAVASPAIQARASAAQSCASTDTVLCIDGRFAVEGRWQTASGKTGQAHAVNVGSESGYFWFFDPANVELIAKSLNACGLGKGNWFFAAGMTTVGVHVQVTDTLTGETKVYDSAAGNPFLPIQDTKAFAFCPTATPTPTATLAPSTTFTPTPSTTPTRTRTPRATRTPTIPPTVESTCRSFMCGFHSCGLVCSFPAAVHIRRGNTLYWQHATTADDGSWSGAISHRFGQAGTFPYHCSAGHSHHTCHRVPGQEFPTCNPAQTTVIHEAGTIIVDP